MMSWRQDVRNGSLLGQLVAGAQEVSAVLKLSEDAAAKAVQSFAYSATTACEHAWLTSGLGQAWKYVFSAPQNAVSLTPPDDEPFDEHATTSAETASKPAEGSKEPI